MQAQLDWPVSALLAYSCEVGHERQVEAPLMASLAVENWPAAQSVQVVSNEA